MAIESESALIFAITKKYHLFFSTPYKVTTIGVQKKTIVTTIKNCDSDHLFLIKENMQCH